MADINIYGTLNTMATDQTMGYARQLLDENFDEKQDVINQMMRDDIEDKQDELEWLNALEIDAIVNAFD